MEASYSAEVIYFQWPVPAANIAPVSLLAWLAVQVAVLFSYSKLLHNAIKQAIAVTM